MELREALYEAAGDGVATITLNRPEQRNPLGPQMVADLLAALQHAKEDDAVRAVVLTGAGDKAFCAGADLSSWAAEASEVDRHLARPHSSSCSSPASGSASRWSAASTAMRSPAASGWRCAATCW